MDYEKNYERLQFERPHDRVLVVRLGPPGKLNSVDAKMHQELVRIWRDIDADEDISSVVLLGNKEGFSAGGDFGLIDEAVNDFHARARQWKETRDLVYNVLHCSKPVVSGMRRVAVGAGLVCGMLADISVAGNNCRIIDGHTRLGVAAGDHAAIIWPILCGMAKAKYYLLLCDPIDGQEAERIGLVSVAVPDEDVDARAISIGARLASGAPYATRWTKNALNGWFRLASPIFDNSLGLEMLGLNSPDLIEGLNSHLEKRPPAFDPTCVL